MDRRVALVTGASRGIGKEIAKALAKEGYIVVINYNGSLDKALDTKKEINAFGAEAMVIKANVSDMDSVSAMIKEVMSAYGRIDVLVNNAGITKDNLILKMSEEEFSQVLETNLTGCFYTSKLVARIMLKQKYGRIINISSIVGVNGNAGQVNYAASKAGMIGLTKSLAKEIGSKGITVNAVAPGFIRTEMTEKLSDAIIENASNNISLRRLGEAKEVADVVAFLASDKASYITGQVIGVDGGLAL